MRTPLQNLTCILVIYSQDFLVLQKHKIVHVRINRQKHVQTRKYSSRMRTDRAATRMTSDRVAMWPIVDRQTTVKTLPSLAVSKYVRIQLIRFNTNFHSQWFT